MWVWTGGGLDGVLADDPLLPLETGLLASDVLAAAAGCGGLA
ncbi:MAG: hypothetical protein ACXWW8_07190 [Solirubrobacterales bacterium]